MAVLDHTEAAFERLIVGEMLRGGGWIGCDPGADGALEDAKRYDADLGLFPDDLIEFVKQTQPKSWGRLVSMASGSEDAAAQTLLKRVAKQLDKHGTVQLLRKGSREGGVPVKLCFFEPELDVDPRAREAYEANRLRVVRQVRFDPRSGDSLDLVLFVNGIPTATAELKNRYTGQTVEHAIRQYMEDRDLPRNVLLQRRALVHFALDADLAYMTTRLAGEATRFLPFNQGTGGPGNPGGAGNPPAAEGGHPTSYVWREVWRSDAWLALLEKFVFVEEPADPKAPGARSTVVFPRYHQWDVVRRAAGAAHGQGPGHSYLIQHSAGSGKSKEIAWLAHDLSILHGGDGQQVFDKVIVVTDRRVLDQQLQKQVQAFEQVKGTVQQITQDSAQLREALEGEQARIVITTLQKFPFVLEQLSESGAALKQRSYAVIVDEAHSSQTGEAATDLKKVLGDRTAEDLGFDDEELDGVPPELLAQLAGRGKQGNLSFFAFTATPKGKTLELFGFKDPATGQYRPFHTYSMRQAIEEGYILDVLRNYTTYEQLYRLENQAREEIEVPKGKGQSRLAAYAQFHPYAKDQKAAVIVEHYLREVRPLLGGQAKAMVVTASREEAVRYKQAIESYVSKRGYEDRLRALVAFSGEVHIRDKDAADYGQAYSEPQMNAIAGKPLSESKLPGEFDKPEYGVLIVAEKYQTGFDQPKLVAMYVDKKLVGVNAVQTLSRLNRIAPGKDQTFVLDFANSAEEIHKAFEPYYEEAQATPTDPNVLFDAAQVVSDYDFIREEDIDRLAQEWFAGNKRHEVLSGATQHAFDAAQHLDDDELRALREALDRFVRFYRFLAQVLPYIPPETEKLYVFSRFLQLRLGSATTGASVNLSGQVQLTHFRLEELGTTHIELGEDETAPLSAITGDGTGAGGGEIPMGLLGELVELFNERFGADLTDADAIRPIQHIVDKVAEAAGLRDQALANDFDDFERGKDALVIGATLEVKDVNDLILQKLLDDEDLRARATHLVMRSLYDRFNTEEPEIT
ncbi:MAG: type I restriction endonuclease [Solirubrobacteraceae bacterium]